MKLSIVIAATAALLLRVAAAGSVFTGGNNAIRNSPLTKSNGGNINGFLPTLKLTEDESSPSSKQPLQTRFRSSAMLVRGGATVGPQYTLGPLNAEPTLFVISALLAVYGTSFIAAPKHVLSLFKAGVGEEVASSSSTVRMYSRWLGVLLLGNAFMLFSSVVWGNDEWRAFLLKHVGVVYGLGYLFTAMHKVALTSEGFTTISIALPIIFVTALALGFFGEENLIT